MGLKSKKEIKEVIDNNSFTKKEKLENELNEIVKTINNYNSWKSVLGSVAVVLLLE
jgi:hypothetical protein